MTQLSTAGKMGAALGVTLLAVTACGAASSSSTSSTTTSGGGSAASAASTASAAAGTVIKTASGTAGTYLTDGAGRAVYLWTADGKGKATCTGTCAGAWPPVPATGTVTATGGALASDLSTITRSDGSKQVAYDGHALYYFSRDSGPGQTNGQGSNGFGAKWWLVAPAGTGITGSKPASAPGASTPAGY